MLRSVDATVLDQELYSEREAARLLRVAPSTLHYWLEGGTRRGVRYQPIVRAEPKGGHAPVTWAEFVECGWLKQYRRDRVPMKELRAFIAGLRERHGVPYPLAHASAFANQGQLVWMQEAQNEAGLDPEFCLVAEVSGQLLLTPPSAAYVRQAEWEPGDDIVAGWRPHEDSASTVRIRPGVRFGRPAVNGVSTEVLWEQVDAGVSIAEVSELFDLSERDVRWAVSYETAQRAA
jgi:uncharacterized protein (DUF433 family)